MYVKLFQKILDSSIWLERDSTLRVWITLLVSMDSDGFCDFASVDNLARRARVKPCHTRTAIAVLESADPKSSDEGFEGRRIERVQGGWIVLNAKKYRDITRAGDLRKKHHNPSQLVSPRCNSSQVVLPTDLNTSEINKSVPEVEVDTDTTTTTEVGQQVLTPPESNPPKKKRKKFTFESFHPETSRVVNHFLPIWPETRKDGSVVDVSKSMFADRVSKLLSDGMKADELIAAGNMYLGEKPSWPACPQYFFGPGNGKSANFSSYVKMFMYEQSKQVTQ